jgi:hypothetical protein
MHQLYSYFCNSEDSTAWYTGTGIQLTHVQRYWGSTVKWCYHAVRGAPERLPAFGARTFLALNKRELYSIPRSTTNSEPVFCSTESKLFSHTKYRKDIIIWYTVKYFMSHWHFINRLMLSFVWPGDMAPNTVYPPRQLQIHGNSLSFQ